MKQTNHSDTSKPSEASPSFRFLTIHHRDDEGAPVALALEFTSADDVSDCPAGSIFLYDVQDPFPSIVPAAVLGAYDQEAVWRLTAAQLILTEWTPRGLLQDSRYWASGDGPRCPALIASGIVPDALERGQLEGFLLRNCPSLRPLLRLQPDAIAVAACTDDPGTAGRLIKEAARWQWLTLCTGDPDRASQEEAEPKMLGPYLFTGDIGSTSVIPPGPKRGGSFDWPEDGAALPEVKLKSQDNRRLIGEMFRTFAALEKIEEGAAASGLRGTPDEGGEYRAFVRDLEASLAQLRKSSGQEGAEDAQ